MAMPDDWDDQLEQKKWLVDRFEAFMESMLIELTNVRELFKVRVSRIEMTLKEWRNWILAGVVFVATVLLGISSAFYSQIGVNYQLIIQILFIDIISGIIAFIVLFILREKAYSVIQSGDLAFVSAINKLNTLNGYFIVATEDIHDLEIERLNFFLDYQKFAGRSGAN
jgi:hypothetical protein